MYKLRGRTVFFGVVELKNGIWFGVHDHGLWVFFNGQFSHEDVQRLLTFLGEKIPELGPGALMFSFANSPRMFNAEERQALVELVRSGGLQALKRNAIVTNNSIARGILTAMNWIIAKPYDEKIFADPAAAIDWLYAGKPPAKTLKDAMERAVPAAALLLGDQRASRAA